MAGTQILTGANSYSGGTTIVSGTLQIGSGGTSGSIVGNVADNGTLAFNRSDDVSFAGVVSGSGALEQDGAGTLTLGGTNTYTGGTTVRSGTLSLMNARSAGTGTITLDDGTTLLFADGIDVANDLAIDGATTLEVASGTAMTAEELLSMNWFVEGVDGNIPQ